MKCAYCDKEIFEVACPECGSMNPEGAMFCMACGTAVRDTVEAVAEDDNDFDFENRVLCLDGTCTGIIVNGKCSECGKPYKKGNKSRK